MKDASALPPSRNVSVPLLGSMEAETPLTSARAGFAKAAPKTALIATRRRKVTMSLDTAVDVRASRADADG
jgi:hypothetical protein